MPEYGATSIRWPSDDLHEFYRRLQHETRESQHTHIVRALELYRQHIRAEQAQRRRVANGRA